VTAKDPGLNGSKHHWIWSVLNFLVNTVYILLEMLQNIWTLWHSGRTY